MLFALMFANEADIGGSPIPWDPEMVSRVTLSVGISKMGVDRCLFLRLEMG